MVNMDEETLKKSIGKLIVVRRKLLRLSQEKLAEMLEIKTRTLSKIENGHTFLSAKILCKLCEIFKITPKAFFDMENSENIDEAKLNEIIEKLRCGGNDKINLYYEIINLIDRKYE
jgi:transcriptional regulator with XRE-family HTH domain